VEICAMKKLQPALAASLSVLLGLAACVSVAEARGGGGGHGGGGHGGGGFHGGGERGFGGGGDRGFRGGGREGGNSGYRPGRDNPGFGPRGRGYGFYPPVAGNGRGNPYARDAIPWINMDYSDLVPDDYYQNNSGSQLPNDCNYLFKKAMDSGSPEVWRLFNDCSHNR
jgi:hypothetical protein